MASSTVPPISHILYIVPDSKGCELAVNIVKQYPALKKEVHLQDIKLIEKPAWLRGVPVLAKVATREIWEGSSAIEQLHYLAGYYSALQTMPTTSNQPWAAYQTNLTLPQPVATHTPAQVSPIPPVQAQVSPSPPVPAPIQSPPQPISLPPPPSNPSLPPPNPSLLTPPAAIQRSQVQPSTRSESDPADPNKIQPLPLPDDQRPQQELALPPLPKNIKTLVEQPSSSITNSQPVSNPPPLPHAPQPIPNRQPLPLANLNTVQSPPPPSEESNDPVDHVAAVVFTQDELETIQRVMFKPKTVNKRPNAYGSDEVFHVDETVIEERRGHGQSMNSPHSSNVRIFPVAERTHSTIIQKDDGDGEEEPQPASA